MLAELLRYLEYPFVRYAIVAAMLISCALHLWELSLY